MEKNGLSGRSSFSLNPVQITAGCWAMEHLAAAGLLFQPAGCLAAVLPVAVDGLLSNISQDLLMLLGSARLEPSAPSTPLR